MALSNVCPLFLVDVAGTLGRYAFFFHVVIDNLTLRIIISINNAKVHPTIYLKQELPTTHCCMGLRIQSVSSLTEKLITANCRVHLICDTTGTTWKSLEESKTWNRVPFKARLWYKIPNVHVYNLCYGRLSLIQFDKVHIVFGLYTEVELSPDPVHSPVDAELPEMQEELGGLGVLDIISDMHPSQWKESCKIHTTSEEGSPKSFLVFLSRLLLFSFNVFEVVSLFSPSSTSWSFRVFTMKWSLGSSL